MIYIALLLSTILCFSSCVSLISSEIITNNKRHDYYSDKSNYITLTATILKWDITGTRITIRVSNILEYPSSQDEWEVFEIVGDNVDIVMKKGIESFLKEGKEIQFVTAPEDFWDSYTQPIVALTIDGVVLLEQEIGIENYLKTI